MWSLYPSQFYYLQPVCVSFHGCHVSGWRCLCDGFSPTDCQHTTRRVARVSRRSVSERIAGRWTKYFHFQHSKNSRALSRNTPNVTVCMTNTFCSHVKGEPHLKAGNSRWKRLRRRGGFGNNMFDAPHTAVILFQFLTSFCTHALWRGSVFTTASLK